MCICALFQAANDCMRKVLGIICCILCAGPILVIVGIVLLTTPNDRAERVSAYNLAATSFNSDGIAGWAVGGTIGGQSVSAVTESVEMESGQTGVDTTGTSKYVRNAQSPFNSVPSSQTFALTTVTTFTRSMTKTRSRTVSIYCSASSSSSCSSSSQSSKCSSQYGGTYSGSSCDGGKSCGVCTYDVYLRQFCAVAQRTTPGVNTWSESSKLQSCFYPFGSSSQEYETTSSAITVRLMDSTDPFISLQRETKGTGNFGITAEQQRNMGIVLLIIGLVIIFVLAIILFVVIRLIMKAAGGDSNNSNNNNATVVQAQPMPQPAYNNNPGYAQQQQPGYGQQQPGYGQQQQQGYGVPPPAGGYGAPPPAGGYMNQPQPPAPGFNQGYPAQGYPVQSYPQGQPQPGYNQGYPQPGYDQSGGKMY